MKTSGQLWSRHRRTVACAALLGAGGIAALACGDRDSVLGFEEPDASDREGGAELPPVSNYEGGADVDTSAEEDASVPFDGAPDPVVCAVTPCVTQLAGGDTYFCALTSDGMVRCWGTDFSGSLGRPDFDAGADTAATPAPVEGLDNVTQLAARQAACALIDGGTVKCWGSNAAGQLGGFDPPTYDNLAHPSPAEVPLYESAVRVDTNDNYTCAVLASGKLECWGWPNNGLLARPPGGIGVGGPDIATKIEAKVIRSSTGSAITEDGDLITWGAILGRETSLPLSHPSFQPLPIPSLHDVYDVAAEATTMVGRPLGHACVVASGLVYCWGTTNAYAALCTGLANVETEPVQVPLSLGDGGFAKQVTVSKRNTCIRLDDGTVQCCGVDDFGQLGKGAVTDGGLTLDEGVPVAPLLAPATAVTGDVVQVVLGGDTACALLREGSVECWGSNAYGQLGQGTRDTAPHPVPVRVQF